MERDLRRNAIVNARHPRTNRVARCQEALEVIAGEIGRVAVGGVHTPGDRQERIEVRWPSLVDLHRVRMAGAPRRGETL
ncbi:MAG: hypothetical protein R2733_18080 [Acidimicrobiales bacterium]